MGLDAKLEVRIGSSLILTVNVHPRTPMDTLVTVLEDLAADIRRDLESKYPLLTMHERPPAIDPATATPTPPAAYSGRHLSNMSDTSWLKMLTAIDLGDTEAAKRHFDRWEKLMEWKMHNYTPEAIKNGPISDHKDQ